MQSVYSSLGSPVRLLFVCLELNLEQGCRLNYLHALVWHKMQLFVRVFLEWQFLSFADSLLAAFFWIAVRMNEYIYICLMNKSTTQLKYSYRSSSVWRSWKLVHEFLWFSLSFGQPLLRAHFALWGEKRWCNCLIIICIWFFWFFFCYMKIKCIFNQ